MPIDLAQIQSSNNGLATKPDGVFIGNASDPMGGTYSSCTAYYNGKGNRPVGNVNVTFTGINVCQCVNIAGHYYRAVGDPNGVYVVSPVAAAPCFYRSYIDNGLVFESKDDCDGNCEGGQATLSSSGVHVLVWMQGTTITVNPTITVKMMVDGLGILFSGKYTMNNSYPPNGFAEARNIPFNNGLTGCGLAGAVNPIFVSGQDIRVGYGGTVSLDWPDQPPNW